MLKEVISADILQTSGFDFLMIFHDFSCPEPSIFDERLERNAYFCMSCIFIKMLQKYAFFNVFLWFGGPDWVQNGVKMKYLGSKMSQVGPC